MNTVWRRIVSTAVAILFVTSTVLVCAPTAAATEGHCKPAQRVEPGCHHSPQKDVLDCCVSSAPQPSSIPQDTSQQPSSAQTTSNGALSQADAVVVVAALQPQAVARLVRGAPLHGYRSLDLPTLNASFLI